MQRRALNHRNVVARKIILRQQFPHLELHQLEQLRIIHRVALVQEHHDVGHAHLPRQQDMLPRLRHRTIGRRHHQDRAVHLRRAGDHVLDVVGVTGTIHMRVVAVGGLILHVRHRDRDAAGLLFRRVVDRIKRTKRHRRIVLLQNLGDRRRQRRLAVIDMPDRPHVYVRLAAIKFLLRHFSLRLPIRLIRFVPSSIHPARPPRPSHKTAGGRGRIRTFVARCAADLQSAAFDRSATVLGNRRRNRSRPPPGPECWSR